MPEINYNELEGHINSGRHSPIYLICGDEAYLRRLSLEMLKKKFMPRSMTALNYSEFDGSYCTIDEIASAVETMPVMTELRMVLVKDLDAAAISAEQYRKLEALLNTPYDTCILIFFNVSVKSPAKSGDKQGAMRSLIKKNGTVINCNSPSLGEICDIIVASARGMKSEISRADASYMVERCGSDITNLLNELAKLSSLCGGRITRSAIDGNTTQSVDVKAYMLASNVIQGRRREAFVIMEELFEERMEPVAVLAIMSGSFIDLYRAKLAAYEGKTAEDIVGMFRGEYKGKERRLGFSFRDSRRYSVELLREWCMLLAQTDAEIKSSKVDGKIILEKMLGQLFVIAERYR